MAFATQGFLQVLICWKPTPQTAYLHTCSVFYFTCDIEQPSTILTTRCDYGDMDIQLILSLFSHQLYKSASILCIIFQVCYVYDSTRNNPNMGYTLVRGTNHPTCKRQPGKTKKGKKKKICTIKHVTHSILWTLSGNWQDKNRMTNFKWSIFPTFHQGWKLKVLITNYIYVFLLFCCAMAESDLHL